MLICRLDRNWRSPRLQSTTVPPCALTIGNFDGVHRGHQAVLSQLAHGAARLNLSSCVLTFEPHPRDFFAQQQRKPQLAPARISSTRDKLLALRQYGVDRCVIAPFNHLLAQTTAQDFVAYLLVAHLNVQWLLVGDDFRFGAGRQGDFALLEQAGKKFGFEVARIQSFLQNGQRTSSSLVREALQRGALETVTDLLDRPYSVSGHVVHGRRLGRELGFRTLNLRFSHGNPAASGIFAVHVLGLSDHPLQGVANLGIRPTLDANDVNGGKVLLETHVLNWPSHLGSEEAYGKIIQVNLLHKLHDELRYDSLEALTQGIQKDCEDARAYFAASHTQTRRQTTRDRI